MNIEICTDAPGPTPARSEVLSDPKAAILPWLAEAIRQIGDQVRVGGNDFIVLCLTCDSGRRMALELKPLPNDEADLFFSTP